MSRRAEAWFAEMKLRTWLATGAIAVAAITISACTGMWRRSSVTSPSAAHVATPAAPPPAFAPQGDEALDLSGGAIVAGGGEGMAGEADDSENASAGAAALGGSESAGTEAESTPDAAVAPPLPVYVPPAVVDEPADEGESLPADED